MDANTPMSEDEARAVAQGTWGRTCVQIAKHLAAQNPPAANAYELNKATSLPVEAAQFTISTMRRAGLIAAARGGGRLKRRPYHLTPRGVEFAALCTKLKL